MMYPDYPVWENYPAYEEGGPWKTTRFNGHVYCKRAYPVKDEERILFRLDPTRNNWEEVCRIPWDTDDITPYLMEELL